METGASLVLLDKPVPPPPHPSCPCRGTEGRREPLHPPNSHRLLWTRPAVMDGCPLMSPALCSRPLVLRPPSAGVTGGGAPVHGAGPSAVRAGHGKRTRHPRRDEEDERKDGFAGAELNDRFRFESWRREEDGGTWTSARDAGSSSPGSELISDQFPVPLSLLRLDNEHSAAPALP